jgi:hypothetical protein
MEKVFGRGGEGATMASLLRMTGVVVPDAAKAEATVHAMPLRVTARAIAANTGKKGAIIITLGSDGIHVAADGLDPDEVREALCTAIHASFLFDEG